MLLLLLVLALDIEAADLLGWGLLELALVIHDLSDFREAVDLGVDILHNLALDLLHLVVQVLRTCGELMLKLVVDLLYG